jgi:PHP family Zn ribbon phosphoesterase
MELKTKNGSTVISNDGQFIMGEFNWMGEDACLDCKPEVADDLKSLRWECEVCGGGCAKLYEVV